TNVSIMIYALSLHDALPIFVHLFYIQRIEIIPTQILSKNVFLLVDVIMISSSYGIKTSMCLVMNFKNRKNSNILRQKRIEFFDKDRKSTRLNSSHVKISYAV